MTDLPNKQPEAALRAAYQKDAGDEAFFAALNEHLARFNPPPVATPTEPQSHALVYVVGVPRSGTTLLSQLVAKHLDIGYINNLVARFWRNPAVGIRLSQACVGSDVGRQVTLESNQGVTSGVAGPHEFGYFWRHWLRLDDCSTHHLTAAQLAKLDQPGLSQALASITAGFNRSVMFKNVICGLHAKFLTALHPRSLFVWIRRDEESTVRSILQARHNRSGSYQPWWSLKPSTFPFPQLGVDPVVDVVRQVRDCAREFAAELAQPGVNAIEIDYDAMCRNPAAALQQITKATAALGGNAPAVGAAPKPLNASRGKPLPSPWQERVEELCTLITTRARVA